jgi:O-antigen ligase
MHQSMRTSAESQEGWYPRPTWQSTAGVAAFAVLGMVLSLFTFPLFRRFGFAAVVMVIGTPFLLALFVRAIPELFSGLQAVRKSFSWREGCLALLFLSAATFAVRNVNTAVSQPLDALAALRFGPELIVAVILASRIASGKSSLKYMLSGVPACLTLFCLVSLLSTLWSIVPIWTFFKSGEFLLDVTLAAVIFQSATRAEDYLKVLNWIWILYAVETLIPWVGAVVSPATAWDDLGRLRADIPLVGPNNIGATGAVLALVAISRLLWHNRRPAERAWYWSVFIFGMASLLVAQTRNAIGGFLLGLPLVLLFANRKWVVAALAGLGVPLLLLTSASTIASTYLRRGQSDEEVQGLTGRMDWWNYAWQQVSFHPWTGLGMYAGGRFGVLARMGRAEAGYMHSDWLEVAVGTSFWGILTLLAAVLGSWWYLCKGALCRRLSALERSLAAECIGVMAVLTVHSIFNDEFCWHVPLLFLGVLGCAEMLRRRMKDTARRFVPWNATTRPDLYSPVLGSRA